MPDLRSTLTIRAKVGVIVALALTLAMSGALIALLHQAAERRIASRLEYLQATASVLAASASQATAAGDRAAAKGVLRGIARAPQIIYARLDRGGRTPLAEIGAGVMLDRDRQVTEHAGRTPGVFEALRTRRLAVSADVIDGGREVGALSLVADNSDLGPALVQMLFGWLLVFALTLTFTLALTGRWVGALLGPLLELTRAARRLAQTSDYASKVDVKRSDEIGVLGAAFNDMVDAIQARDGRILGLASTDVESGLPNRSALLAAIDAALSCDDGKAVLVAAFGIERFREVRNAIGYAGANALVAGVGARLSDSPGAVAVGRISSDVLGVLVSGDTAVDARLNAFRMIDVCARSVEIDGHLVDAPVRAGYASGAGEDAAALVEQASIALDQVRARQQKFGAFDKQAYGDPTRTLSLMSDMRKALGSGALTLHLQPKLDLRTGRITEAEALARWTDEARGLVPPDMFITLAEETGAIRILTEWAVDTCIRQQQQIAAVAPEFSVAVNISGKLFCDVEFVRLVLEKVTRSRANLSLEITETAVIADPESALKALAMCADAGVAVAIDDYGVGLSSLEYLKRMAANELKIDKSYIAEIEKGGRERVIVSSTIQLAHSLGMKVTAEGVESAEALAALQLLGCDKAQGYFIGRPMSADAMREMLAAERVSRPSPPDADRSTVSARS